MPSCILDSKEENFFVMDVKINMKNDENNGSNE
jgi:hypothetical protein